jgi:hypothetical protein
VLRRRNVISGSLIVLLIAVMWLAGSPVLAQGGRPGGRLLSAPSTPAFSIDLYERTVNAAGQGTPTESGPMVLLPNAVGPGYTVIMDCGDPASATDRANPDNWSDVLVFPDNRGTNGASAPSLATTVKLLSRGASFPSLATVTSNPNAFIQELQAGTGTDDGDVTLYVATPNNYFVHSAARNGRACPIIAAPAQVPEGDTLVLVGTGLAGLAGYASLRWRASRAKTARLV